MGIKGFQGTSLLDYPGRIASLIFFGGCNLTCPFCHNPALVIDPGMFPDYPGEILLAELNKRRSFIDGVVMSGGEPTLDPGLLPLLREVKRLGLPVKLDTNGLIPEVLVRILEEQLADYLAVDLKTAPQRYGELHRGPVDISALHRSLKVVLDGPVDYEFRTTCVPGLVEEEDIERMGKVIRGARRWVLQQYVSRHALDERMRDLAPHSPEKIESLAALAGRFVEEVDLRGL